MTKPIDVGPGYDTLAEAMEAEGVYQIRRHDRLNIFTVELTTGQVGAGRTIRDAISKATQDTFCKSVAA
jgi:hypothetical protein